MFMHVSTIAAGYMILFPRERYDYTTFCGVSQRFLFFKKEEIALRGATSS
jgi:hypothetical protein